MKKIVAFILLCAFVVAIPVLSTVSVSGEDEMAYVVLGDSIAAGYRIDGLGTDGVAGINDSAYAGLVAKKFGLKLYNFAWCGHTSVDLVNRINGKVRVNASGGRRPSDMGEYVTVADAIAAAELVTISIGGNDLLDLLNFDQLELSTITAIISGNVSPQISQVYVDAETNLRKAITRISEINPDAIIMVQTLYNPYIYETFLGGYVKGSGINYLIDKLNDIIYGLCEEMGNFYVAETAKALNADPGSFYSLAGGEDFHPTIIGHRHIADVISELYTSLKFGSGTDNTTAQTTVATVEASTKQATAATTVATTEQTTVATTAAMTEQTTAATTAAMTEQATAAT
ncbi:MAG: GDSL-type esterase/lipase family protein, partial [Clostridia bacterium]|nr:GDSL-type esterase/lipase family protein [Clostridia bacterium]